MREQIRRERSPLCFPHLLSPQEAGVSVGPCQCVHLMPSGNMTILGDSLSSSDTAPPQTTRLSPGLRVLASLRNNTRVWASGAAGHCWVWGAAVLSASVPALCELCRGGEYSRVGGASGSPKVAHGCSLVNHSLGLITECPEKTSSSCPTSHQGTCFPCTAHRAGPMTSPSRSHGHCPAAECLRAIWGRKAQGALPGFVEASCGWLQPAVACSTLRTQVQALPNRGFS